MRVLVYPINLKSHRDKFDLYLGGDLHLGDPDCDEDAWARLIDEVQSNSRKRTTRLALMGDYIYSFPKLDNRNWGKKPKGDDVLDLYTAVRNSVKPVARNVVACLAGNHDEDWLKSERIDFVNWLCAETGMPYCGYECYIRFKVTVSGDAGNRRNVDVLLWHGAGGGRTVGGAFNKAKNPIDCFRTPSIVAMAHLHRLGMTHEQYMTIDEEKLDVVATDQYFVLTGGYQKGYAPPQSSYVSRKMLPPIALGGVKLTIQPFRDVGNKDALNVEFSEVR